MTDTSDHAVIHLNVTKARKRDWIQRAQAEGKKLSDWIIDRVESPLHDDPPRGNDGARSDEG